MTIYWLRISTFSGFVAFATHYYGEITFHGADHTTTAVRLSFVTTNAQAKALSEKDFKYIQGSRSERFSSRDDVVSAAIGWFKSTSQIGDRRILVLEGDSLNPGVILAGGTKRERASSAAMVRKIESLYGNSSEPSSWDEYDKVCAQWQKMIARYMEQKCTA